jgi:hypothetical protein
MRWTQFNTNLNKGGLPVIAGPDYGRWIYQSNGQSPEVGGHTQTSGSHN